MVKIINVRIKKYIEGWRNNLVFKNSICGLEFD